MYDRSRNVCGNNVYSHDRFGALGFSVHVTENADEILAGAPGVFKWSGSVIRYRRNQNGQYISDVPNPGLWNYQDDAFFGYALSSGHFGESNKSKLLYVASAPRDSSLNGSVHIFDIINISERPKHTTIQTHKTFEGEQMGEYFGYSLVTEDFNGDGRIDIAIGAPFHTFDTNG